jgi:hypothetical protein
MSTNYNTTKEYNGTHLYSTKVKDRIKQMIIEAEQEYNSSGSTLALYYLIGRLETEFNIKRG